MKGIKKLLGSATYNNPEIDLSSRQAILWMHPSALVLFMTSARWVIKKGHLPEDVKFHNVFWVPERNVWAVVCTSKEFEPVLAGQKLPELPQVEFRYWNPEKDEAIQ